MSGPIVPPLIREPLQAAAIVAGAGAGASLLHVEVLERCDSTNAALIARAEAGAPGGLVLAAQEQTAGRGRRGRAWVTVPGGSLAFSLLWRFAPGSPMPMGLSLAVGVGLVRALDRLGVTGAGLKWPNDVQVAGGKLAGVLVELAKGPAAVIGVGVNLWLPAEVRAAIDQPVATLADALDPLPSPNAVLGALLGGLVEVLEVFDHKGFVALRDEWASRHVLHGCEVTVSGEGGNTLAGRCAGVDVDGALILVDGARVQRVVGGDVSLRPA